LFPIFLTDISEHSTKLFENKKYQPKWFKITQKKVIIFIAVFLQIGSGGREQIPMSFRK